MPIYTFVNPEGEELNLIRPVEERDTPVTAEEEGNKTGPWTRIVNTSAKFNRGPNWNHKKPGTREVMNTIKIRR